MLFLLTYPGAPCIYYGNEIGVDGEHDPHSRKSFPWDERKWDHDLRAYVKQAVALRHQNAALRRGDFKRLWSVDGIYVFSRSFEGSTVVIGLNTSESPRQAHVTYEPTGMPKALLGDPTDISIGDGRLRFTVPPRSGVVLK
jgi:glycosidase